MIKISSIARALNVKHIINNIVIKFCNEQKKRKKNQGLGWEDCLDGKWCFAAKVLPEGPTMLGGNVIANLY